jgi:hypothetical protein
MNPDFGLIIGKHFYLVSSLASGRVADVQNGGTGRHIVVKTRLNKSSQRWYFDQNSLTIKNVQRGWSISMHNRNSKANQRDYIYLANTHGRTNNSWQRFRWNEKESALELVKDGRRLDIHGALDHENQICDYHPRDSNRPTQKWKLVYADKMEKIQSKGEANGFRIGKPFYIQTQFGRGKGELRRVVQAHGHHHVRLNDIARNRNNRS